MPSYHFMIIEATPSVAFVLQHLILRRYPQASIRIYSHGCEALRDYNQTGADLLVINHWLPGMSGLRLIQHLRAQGDHVPVIGIADDPEAAVACLTAGATTFLAGIPIITDLTIHMENLLR